MMLGKKQIKKDVFYKGKLADIIGIHESYMVNAVCFGYLLIFGVIAKKVLAKQGIAIVR
ncbi:hypothetical protein [Myroides fluvii]|uniref:hypothetical protein n=1 Tax=Myroides fluvii TaxID=2572594 RepID=UPI00131BC3E2|nr:hypothetical protein [Myroides fluvii]